MKRFLLIIVCIVFGYGHIVISHQIGNETVLINSQPVNTKSGLKLRPGKYIIEVSSPQYDVKKTIHLLPFLPRTINAQAVKRDFREEIKTALSFSFGLNDINISKSKIIDKYWFAGLVDTPSEEDLVVLGYKNGVWSLVYAGYGPESAYSSLLPQTVDTYLNSLGSVHPNGN